MSGALRPLGRPVELQHDPTNPALQPLIQQLATQFGAGGFDAEQYGGQFGAPLNTLQLDSMGAIERMLGADPLAQTSDIQGAIAQATGGAGPNAPGTDLSGFNQNFNQIMGQAGQAGQGLPGTDLSGIMQNFQNAMGQAGGGQGTDLINQATQLSPELQQIFGSSLPAFQNMLNAPSFDTTGASQQARQVFESDLENMMASGREQFSAAGLDPGSATREAALARAGAGEAARFGLGQEEMARQGFESAQNRQLQALGMAPSMSQAFGSPQDRMLQAGGMLGQLGLQGAGMQGDILSQMGQFAQIPFQEAMQAQGLGLQGTGLQANMLPQQLAAGQIPFQEAMQQYGAGLQGQQVGANMLPSLMQAFNNPAMMAQLGMGMGETARGAEQGGIDRQMMEFGRTQNAMLPFMMQLLAGTPQTQMNYGPSRLSQAGNFIGSMIPFAGGGD